MMKKLYLIPIFLLCIFMAEAQVKVFTNFASNELKRAPIHDVWQVANDISPTYSGSQDKPQIRPDMKMNIIRLSGGIKSGSQKDTGYDMVSWSSSANDYVYDFSRLINVINKADQKGDEIYQLVIDNVPWAFQRGYTFVDLPKNQYNNVNFRKFEEVEQYGNALPPNNKQEYRQYVEALMQALVDNFGMNRVKSWRFRIGSEIESPGHWKGTAEDFIEYFDISIRAIRKIVPGVHVGVHTREPRYVAVSSKGLNYKGEKFVSFHREILNHAAANNLQIDSWGLSYYIQFDKAGEYHTDMTWYNEWVADLVNHPNWNPITEINLEEFKATASFRAPDGRAVTLKSASSHGQVAHIAMSNLFYQRANLDQIHRWLQTEDVKDEVANTELLAMVGKTRYATRRNGTPNIASNVIDGIFALDESTNTYEALIYNYNGASTSYQAAEPVTLSLITDLPVGTKVQFRSSHYSRSHNKLQSFVAESDFQDSWYVDGIKDGQKLGTPSRVLKPTIYNDRYVPYDGNQTYGYSNWLNTTTKARSDGSSVGSEIVIQTNLQSFSFRKYEFKPDGQQPPQQLNVRITSPANGQTFLSSANIQVEAVEANGQPVSEMQLFINNQFVRTESLAPYQWGQSSNSDPALFNLSAGTYNLRVRATNASGQSDESQITIQVGSGGSGTIVHMRKNNLQSFSLDGGNGGANNQAVKLWSTNTSNANQQWEEISVGNGFYQYRKLNTDYCIDGGNGATSGQLVKLWPCNQSNQNQHWKKVGLGDDIFLLEKRNSGGLSIDGQSGGVDGRQVVLSPNRNSVTSSQAWLFSSASGASNRTNEALSRDQVSDPVSIYPNPTSDRLNIHIENQNFTAGSVSITSMSGKTVLRETFSEPKTQINIESLPTGSYMILINNGNETITRKMVVR